MAALEIAGRSPSLTTSSWARAGAGAPRTSRPASKLRPTIPHGLPPPSSPHRMVPPPFGPLAVRGEGGRPRLMIAQQRAEAVELVREALGAVGVPERGRIDGDHRLPQPPLGLRRQLDHREVRPALDD